MFFPAAAWPIPQVKTHMKKKTLDPVFDEHLILNTTLPPERHVLRIAMHDWDMFSSAGGSQGELICGAYAVAAAAALCHDALIEAEPALLFSFRYYADLIGEVFIDLKRFRAEHKAGQPVEMNLSLRVFQPSGLAFRVRSL